MNKITLAEYLRSPCRVLSIPYWKQKNINVPSNIKIVHDEDYKEIDYANYIDEPYFRLYHDLKHIKQSNIAYFEIVAASSDMISEFVDIINASYTDLSVTKQQMESCINTPVYCSDLWILLKDKKTGKYVGSGIADYDEEIGEVTLEWIQVLPSYRRRGLGQMIVNNLLTKMQMKAKFATVSGKVRNPANPEKLYRKCGFTGNDVWHILKRKENV